MVTVLSPTPLVRRACGFVKVLAAVTDELSTRRGLDGINTVNTMIFDKYPVAKAKKTFTYWVKLSSVADRFVQLAPDSL